MPLFSVVLRRNSKKWTFLLRQNLKVGLLLIAYRDYRPFLIALRRNAKNGPEPWVTSPTPPEFGRVWRP